MKKSTCPPSSLFRWLAVIGTAALVAGAHNAAAQTGIPIGFNFVNTGTSGVGGDVNTNETALLPEEIAGVSTYAQSNWNNCGNNGGGTFTVTNAAGSPVSLVLNWSCGFSDTSGDYATLGTPDGKLFDGYLSTWNPGAAVPLGNSVNGSSIHDKPLVYIRGLDAWLAAQGAVNYTVVFYFDSYTYWEESESYIESVSGDPLASTMVEGSDLTPHYYDQQQSHFSGTYSQVTSTNVSSAQGGVNYALFTALTNDAILLRRQAPTGGYAPGLCGFQIVPILGCTLIPGTPTFSPANTVYAGSPVTIAEAVVTGSGVLGYQWQTDGGSGGSLTNIPGATSTNLAVIPPDLGSTYTINYQVVVSNSCSVLATSSVVTLTVNQASGPLFTSLPAITNLVTFAGQGFQTETYTENGTLPITNQWQFDNGGGYVSLAGQTNTSLTISNLQTTSSGNYQAVLTNAVGDTNIVVTFTVLPDPAAPTPGQATAYKVYTNSPWAYWRLIETNDPTAMDAPTYTAFDYSGHGFDAYYGNIVTVSNAGPDVINFPGLPGQLAAGLSSPSGYLTVPSLNLSGNHVTFMAWINPNSSQANYTGLLMNRGGADVASGFGYGTNDYLGYNWNNNSAAYNWSSGLQVQPGVWNFVAYVITPTNATAYLGVVNPGVSTNFVRAINPVANAASTFSGGKLRLGGDPNNNSLTFNGLMAEAALFTNSMSYAQVQQYFLTAAGITALPPSLGPTTVSPSAATGTGVYSGQNVILSAQASGTPPLTLQWQASPDGVTWTNVPGADSEMAVVNPFNVGTLNYQLKASNLAGSATNAPVAVVFNALPASPAGLWTVNFQVTNNVLSYAPGSGGLGYYSGRGILGQGSYWNAVPDLSNSGNIVSVSDLKDDGVTHSGIYCYMNGAGYAFSSATAPNPVSADIGNFLNQWANYYSSNNVNGLQFKGVPDGTYNLTIYDADSVWNDRGATFTVHDTKNGDQSGSTENDLLGAGAWPLSLGGNFVLFNNVHVSGGTLSCDVAANGGITSHPGSTEVDFNGAQLQLVSLDVLPPTVYLTNTVSGSSLNLMNLSWSQGVLETSTNLLGPWTPIYSPSPLTVPITTTNSTQFYRVKAE